MTAFASLAAPDFVAADPRTIADRLAAETALRNYSQRRESIEAWLDWLGVLRLALRDLSVNHATQSWRVLLEYPLLRREKRIDAVLVTPRLVVAIEFKQADSFLPTDERQVLDYALDLVDFHSGCNDVAVAPVLCATAAPVAPSDLLPLALPGPIPIVQRAGRGQLASVLDSLVTAAARAASPRRPELNPSLWEAMPYRPTPTIIEAATMLYGRARAADVKSARADAANLTRTTDAILRTIREARRKGQHAICFVTGVPGAGKTLCGLNAVFAEIGSGAAFLSGNRPLVLILQEALARDEAERTGRRLDKARRDSAVAIQNLMAWLNTYLDQDPDRPPHEHIIVFDEAQRAWDAAFGWRKFRRRDAEAALVLDIMARHRDWAVVIALVGQGQEINTGEAGLSEWGRAIQRGWVAGDPMRFWHVHAAPEVVDASTLAAGRLFDTRGAYPPGVALDDALDLRVSVRALRAAAHADWVAAVLDDRPEDAAAIAREWRLEIGLTRDLPALRVHLRSAAQGDRRCGLVASSGARRLRAEGLGAQIAEDKDLVDWFLKPHGDIRSSNALEVLATEFSCQGLELDQVGVCWGGDLIRSPQGRWQARALAGNRWQIVGKSEEREWIRNTYRVLLTRSRYRTCVFVPRGSTRADPWHDATRDAADYDAVADFLLACGARPLDLEALAPAAPAPSALLL